MAQITRQLWSALRDEAILAAGGHAYTGFSGRVEYWMTQAYYDLCAMYHQYELDAEQILAIPTGASKVDLPTNCFIVVAVGVVDSSDLPIRFLRMENFKLQGGAFRSQQASSLSPNGRVASRKRFNAANGFWASLYSPLVIWSPTMFITKSSASSLPVTFL